MRGKRVIRFIGNRPVPEPELFDRDMLDPIAYVMGVDWGQKTPKSMSLDDLREFSKACPNPLESDFGAVDKTAIGKLYTSTHFRTVDAVEQMFQQSFADLFSHVGCGVFETTAPIKKKEPEIDPEPFEVNLTEPLVGWRRWAWTQPPMSAAPGLRSLNVTKLWKPCEAMEAKCHAGWPRGCTHDRTLVPFENCACGIYAVDQLDDVPGEDAANVFIGRVYGWGRYVRGEDGWRSQFAYPKEFHLRSFQAHLIEPLKAFRVPILIDEPLRVYSPEEEGYSIGDWT